MRIDDLDAAIYGTVGYQAPEIADRRPVDRLGPLHDRPHARRADPAFRGYQGTPTRCPPDRRVLVSGTSRSTGCCSARPTRTRGGASSTPARWPTSCRRAARGARGRGRRAAPGCPRCSAARGVFAAELLAPAQRRRPDPARWQRPARAADRLTDPAAGFLASVTVTDPSRCCGSLRRWRARPSTVRLRLALGRSRRAATRAPPSPSSTRWPPTTPTTGDWRVAWYGGLPRWPPATRRRPRAAFDAVYPALPGELAPQLALASPRSGRATPAAAAGYYDVVSADRPGLHQRGGRAGPRGAAGRRPGRRGRGVRPGAGHAPAAPPRRSARSRGAGAGAAGARARRRHLRGPRRRALIERLEIEAAQPAARGRAARAALQLGDRRTAAPAARRRCSAHRWPNATCGSRWRSAYRSRPGRRTTRRRSAWSTWPTRRARGRWT